jgi:hypothetical protein
MSGVIPLLSMYSFMTWRGKASPFYCVCVCVCVFVCVFVYTLAYMYKYKDENIDKYRSPSVCIYFNII